MSTCCGSGLHSKPLVISDAEPMESFLSMVHPDFEELVQEACVNAVNCILLTATWGMVQEALWKVFHQQDTTQMTAQ